jgi:hypothetical protein
MYGYREMTVCEAVYSPITSNASDTQVAVSTRTVTPTLLQGTFGLQSITLPENRGPLDLVGLYAGVGPTFFLSSAPLLLGSSNSVMREKKTAGS